MNQGDIVGGRYRVESRLGEGGMAAVYRVRHVQLDSSHALKVLKLPAQSIRERLLQEGKVQAQLRHRNLVAVTDTVEHEGSPGLIMEFIDGPSLFGFLKQHRLNLEQADALAEGILAGVAYAHEHGLVHRDLKPENILLAFEGDELVPKVADFGLAKLLSEDGAGPSKTRSGMAMGTPNYMAPEQIRDAKHVDGRADIFALGAILYELVSGRQCFSGADTFEIFSAVANVQYTPMSEVVPGLPDRMQRAIGAALQATPQERPAAVADLRAIWTDNVDSGRQLWSRSMVSAAPESALASAAPAEGGGSETFAFLPQAEEAPPESSRETLAPELSVLSAEEEDPPKASSPSMGLLAAGALLLAGLAGATWVATRPDTEAVPVEPVAEAPSPDLPPEEPVEAPELADADEPLAELSPEAEPEPPPKVEAASVQPKAGYSKLEPVVADAPDAAEAPEQPTDGELKGRIWPTTSPPHEEAPPEVTTGTVVLKGDAKSLWFNGDGRKLPINGTTSVPPGTYTLTAFFEGLSDPQPQGSVSVSVGQTVTVTCSSALTTCNIRP